MLINEKFDFLYTLIWILIWIILLLLFKIFDLHSRILSIGMLIPVTVIPNLITSLRRKNQIKKIECLRVILNVPIEEIRMIAGIGRYDLVDWTWKQSCIPQKKMYLLEDTLEKKYIERYGKAFELEYHEKH
ncbi:hypothetical protein JZO76_06435 [Enterococcus sp. MJM12]|uniref:Uncharacterized protein n=2 Tax=Candidatus Enterococcus myersii TaxID=2815322 RepID=A0ABS3H6T7_9ENTE|nr:hypothetical protein [Enterococcus sp. MJM12]MBO0449173.1 hypothetical protein [Enterococcus sp. MJM12]